MNFPDLCTLSTIETSAVIVDLAVVVAYFALVFSIGLRRRSRENTVEGFALGNRSIPWWAILASILAAEISAATFLGAPGEGIAKRNFTYAQLALGTILGRLVVGWVFLKPFYRYRVVSIYEYLEKRFGKRTRDAASAVFLLSRTLASGVRLYVAGILLVIAMEMFLGREVCSSEKLWLYIISTSLIVIATAIYTTIGGLKAVIWTDVVQAIVLVLAVGSAMVILLMKIPGGWNGVMANLSGPSDLGFVSSGLVSGIGVVDQIKHILLEEYSLFAAFIASMFITMSTHGADQDMVQRMLAGKDSSSSTRAVIVSGLVDMPIVLCFIFTGILVNVFYTTGAGILPGSIPKNEIYPYFIMHELPMGIRGLLIAGLLATAMGSLSTAINALATTFVRDWFARIVPSCANDEARLVRAMKTSSIAFAGLLLLVGILTSHYAINTPGARIIPLILGIFGYTYGALLGVFLLGMLTKTRGSCFGNTLGMVLSICLITLISNPFDYQWIKDLFSFWNCVWILEIAPVWRVMIGTLITVGTGFLFRTHASTLEATQQEEIGLS